MKAPYLSFVVTAQDWESARGMLFTEDGCENAGVFLCGTTTVKDHVRLTAREFIPVPDHLYLDRQSYHLEVSPKFYNEVVSRCVRTGLNPVIIHSHPMMGPARYSQSDDYGESHLLDVLQSLLPDQSVASLVITWDGATGRCFAKGKFVPLRSIRTIGSRVTTEKCDSTERTDLIDETFDRQVRAFGAESQYLLEKLKVGIVGLGGTGSLVAEQVARLGICNIVLVDYEGLETSNLNRVIGAGPSDVGQSKVTVIARHLARFSSSRVEEIADSALKQTVLEKLRDCDVIFGCVDNDRTRAALNRFAHQYLIPVIDMGVRLDARGGEVSAAAGRVTVVGHGATCLRCSHHLNAERIRSESLPQAERVELLKEGYVMGLDEAAPAVVSLNAVVAGLAVTAFLNLFVGLTGGKLPTSQIYDATSGSVFPVSAVHEAGCDVCDGKMGVKGLADSQVVSAY